MAIASSSETAFSTPPEGNISSFPKVPSITQVVPSQEDSHDIARHPKPQQRDQSVADDKQTVESPHSVPQTIPSKKKKGFVAKSPISRTADKGVNSPRGPAPRRRHILDNLERLNQGSSFVRNRSYLKAIKVLKPLFANPPEEWEPWFWMGTAQMGLGHYEKARDYFRNGLKRDETIPELWVQCALAEHQRGKYTKALSLLRQAEFLAPTHPQVHLNLAFTLESQGNTSSAL
ncbi:MAG: tetratricopeptide repeat protein, partial [Nitrospirales bacterium]|nr:tetratricopeptide repeat protein [Nitrospirales bacterium]